MVKSAGCGKWQRERGRGRTGESGKTEENQEKGYEKGSHV